MKSIHRHKGFSLTEVLLAIGTLAIGMSFVGGTFLVGVHLSTVATERTIAAATADEAFAKIQLYGIDIISEFTNPEDGSQLITDISPIPIEELAYPSTQITDDKQYYWSAICRPITWGILGRPKDKLLLSPTVRITVFVSRNVGNSTVIPVPVKIPFTPVTGTGNENKLMITNPDQQSFINAGSKIVEEFSGKIYRVVERDAVSGNIITLEVPWEGSSSGSSVWTIPPTGGAKSPCIAVYQKEIIF